MKYVSTIDVWQPGIIEDLLNGKLKLQCGQWIKCGKGRSSRFVCVGQGGVIHAAHWEGPTHTTARRFKALTGLKLIKTGY